MTSPRNFVTDLAWSGDKLNVINLKVKTEYGDKTISRIQINKIMSLLMKEKALLIGNVSKPRKLPEQPEPFWPSFLMPPLRMIAG
jgi:hypothetical protein